MRNAKCCVRGRRHSRATESMGFANDLRLCDFVRDVGFAQFVPIKTKKPYVRIKYYDKPTSTYKLSVGIRNFEQDLYVRVDPTRKIFFDRFISLYWK